MSAPEVVTGASTGHRLVAVGLAAVIVFWAGCAALGIRLGDRRDGVVAVAAGASAVEPGAVPASTSTSSAPVTTTSANPAPTPSTGPPSTRSPAQPRTTPATRRTNPSTGPPPTPLVVGLPTTTTTTSAATAGPWPTAAAPVAVPEPPALTGPPGSATSYSLLNPGSPSPGRFDPCRPIRYLINDEFSPPGTTELVHQAFLRMGTASGVRFVSAGTTTARPVDGWASVEHPSASGEWPPILVYIGRRADTTYLKEKDAAAIGNGGAYPLRRVGAGASPQVFYVSGVIEIDGEMAARFPVSFGTNSLGVTLLHEIGHVLGLGHVADPTQVMYTHASTPVLGAGDLAGLARVGRAAGCLDTPLPQWAKPPVTTTTTTTRPPNPPLCPSNPLACLLTTTTRTGDATG